MKVAIVCDEKLDEHKREMLSAVKKALEKKFNVGVVPFDENFMKEIKKYDIAFNTATSGGKDGRQLHVPAVLDLLGIPYTTAPALSHALCIDKAVTKSVLLSHGINTAKFFMVYPGEKLPKHDLKFPVIVKPLREGSSKGLRKESVCYSDGEIERAVSWIHENFHEGALVEEFIDGMEVTVGLLEKEGGVEVLPLLEIDFSGLPEGVERFYSDRVKNQGFDKYINYVIPARLDEKIYKTVEEAAKKAFKVLGLRDYARMDVRIKGESYYILDVNSLPLLVPEYSDITKMAKAARMSYDDLILTIINSAIRRYNLKN